MDQALLQDATGTMALMQFEELGEPRVKVERAVQYIDHNVVQLDFKNPDDHLMLQALAREYGLHFSRPGNGISHYIHMERFGKPGQTMLGADSHTVQGGCLGMIAIGAGGLDVAVVLGGHPYEIACPEVVEVRLEGQLQRPWVQAKDIILELLRRLSARGGKNKVFEFTGPGTADLSIPERPPEHTPLGDSLAACVATVQPDDISTGDLAPDGVEVMAYRSNVPGDRRIHPPPPRPRVPQAPEGVGERVHRGRRQLRPGLLARARRARAAAPRRQGGDRQVVRADPPPQPDRPGDRRVDVLRPVRLREGRGRAEWSLPKLHEELESGSETITVEIEDTGDELTLSHDFTEHEREILLAGGLLSYLRDWQGDNGRQRGATSNAWVARPTRPSRS